MKYLFFYIDNQTDSAYTSGLGIASLSGYLKKHGHQTSLVYFKLKSDLEYAHEKIAAYQPHIICFYSTSVGFKTVQFLSDQFRNKYPWIYQIYGGIHAILQPDCIYQIPTMNAICAGYGEIPLLRLGEKIESGDLDTPIDGIWSRPNLYESKTVLKSSPYSPNEKDPDDFLNFDYQIFLDELSRYPGFNRQQYRLEVIFNRTCPFDCSFCCNKRLRQIYQNTPFISSPEKSVAFLKETLQRTNVNNIVFHDDILTLHKKWFREFIELYARDIGKPFVCNLRAGCFDEEDAKLLKRANVESVWIGIESGNEFIRNTLMKKKVSEAQLRESFRIFRKYDITAFSQNIVGLPFETPEHFMDTIRLNAELDPHVSRLSIFFPYPTTELYDVCIENNLIGSQSETFVERHSSILNMPQFSSEKIQFLYQNFQKLLAYQKLRNKNKLKYFIPLRAYTTKLILGYLKLLAKLKILNI